MKKQLMLWETEVVPTEQGQARVVASKPFLEGSVDEARKIMGGMSVISRKDIYRLIKAGYVKAWKKMPGVRRADGKQSNCKLVVDLESVLKHRERMQMESLKPAERKLENCTDCEEGNVLSRWVSAGRSSREVSG